MATGTSVIGYVLVWTVALACPSAALAQPAGAPEPGPAIPAVADGDAIEARELLDGTETRINLRLGVASSDDNGRPVVCLEIRAVSRLSVEGCGTGSGVLHGAPGGELAHFRAKWTVDRRVVRGGALRAQLGLGMAELQIDADQPGFVIRPAPGGVEAVGLESSVGLQWARSMGAGWEIILNATAGLALVPGAADLRAPAGSWQPFVAFEIGAGW